MAHAPRRRVVVESRKNRRGEKRNGGGGREEGGRPGRGEAYCAIVIPGCFEYVYWVKSKCYCQLG